MTCTTEQGQVSTITAVALITTSAAAAELGVHVHTLLRWVKDGRVTPTQRTAGGHYRWDLDDLQRQLRQLGGSDEPESSGPA